MSIELTPLGVACNLGCTYCYEQPLREVQEARPAYDLEAMFAAAEREGVGTRGRAGVTGATIFGGEPLLLARTALERIGEWAQRLGAPLKIQTAGNLITDWHLDWFDRFNVGVGISIDGPGDLNDARWAGTLDGTRKWTARTEQAIRSLCARGRRPSVIVTLSRQNAIEAKLAQLAAWVRDLSGLGVRAWNFHPLEVDGPGGAALRLTDAEAMAAADVLRPLGRALGVWMTPYDDMRAKLAGNGDRATCVFQACDPFTTNAVRGIDGHGTRQNCGRTNKDGVAWVKADQAGHERQLALYLTPQEAGGCQGCRFWAFCGGECPGTGLSGDWRARTEHCAVLMHTFTAIEAELFAEGLAPRSASLERAAIEATLIADWTKGRPDTPGNRPHIDTPHLDHMDVARRAGA